MQNFDSNEFNRLLKKIEFANNQTYPRPWTNIESPQPLNLQHEIPKIQIFLVSLNPIHALNPEFSLQFLYDAFLFIKEENIREIIRNQDPEPSKTRKEIEQISTHLKEFGVLDTNVIPFPSKNAKILNLSLNPVIIKRSQEIFYFLLNTFTPKVIMTFGKGVLYHFLNLIKKDIEESASDKIEQLLDKGWKVPQAILNNEKKKRTYSNYTTSSFCFTSSVLSDSLANIVEISMESERSL